MKTPVPQPLAAAASRARSTMLAGLLVLVTAIAYLPAFNAGFNFDDDILLTANPDMQNVDGLTRIWMGKGTCDYTPLTLTSFWLEKRLWGNSPAGYHIANILLHVLAAVLLWRILETLRIPGAWLGALLFAIHPVNVASVAWIAERKNTLSGVLFFASILAFVVFEKRGRMVWYGISLGLFLLAGLSKGAVVTLPAVLVGCIFWMNRRISARDVIRILPFMVIAALVSFLTIHYQSRAPDFGMIPTSWPFRIARAGAAIWIYLWGILFPMHLSPMSRQWLPDLHSPLTYLPAVLALALPAILLCIHKGWSRSMLFAYGYYTVMLFPVLGFVRMAFQQETPTADWWQYLATAGLFAAMGAGVVTMVGSTATRSPARIALRATVGVVLALLLVQTMRRSATYRSIETYCSAGIAENPQAWTLQNNLGYVFKQRGEFDRAIACYRRALSDNPRFMEAHNNLGNALAATGHWEEARTQFIEALKLNPTNPVIKANLVKAFVNHNSAAKQIRR